MSRRSKPTSQGKRSLDAKSHALELVLQPQHQHGEFRLHPVSHLESEEAHDSKITSSKKSWYHAE